MEPDLQGDRDGRVTEEAQRASAHEASDILVAQERVGILCRKLTAMLELPVDTGYVDTLSAYFYEALALFGSQIRQELCTHHFPELVMATTRRVDPCPSKLAMNACSALRAILETDETTRDYGRRQGVLTFAVDFLRSELKHDAAIVRASCNLARGLIIRDDPPDNAEIEANARLIETLIPLMALHMNDTTTIEAITMALDSYTPNEIKPETLACLYSADSQAIFARALNSHRGSSKLLDHVCSALNNTSGARVGDEERERMKAAGILEATIAAMEAHPNNEFLQVVGSGIFVGACRNLSLRESIIRHGMPTVLAAMERHLNCADLWENGAHAISYIARTDSHRAALLETIPNIGEVFLRALQHFISAPDVLEDTCCAIYHLAHDRAAAGVFIQLGMAPVVQAALQQHPSVYVLVRFAIGVFTRFCAVRGTYRTLNGLNVANDVIWVMTAFPDMAPVQEDCAQILSYLAYDDAVGLQIFQQGAMQACLAAKERFPDREILHSACCVTLCFMSYHEPHADEMTASGVIGALVASMQRFPKNDHTVTYGCDCLGFLARHSSDKIATAMLGADVIEHLLAIMRSAEPTSQRLASAASAVSHLAHSPECRRRFLALDTAAVLLAALAQIPADDSERIAAPLNSLFDF